MPEDLSPTRFVAHRTTLSTGATLAYLREGVGGVPLLLVHGWPETKRIWWRNVEPLVAAGFEVIVPDLRGFGDSDLAPDGHYDVAAFSMDLHALVHEELGHGTCFAAGGDAGGPVIYDLSLRYPGFVPKLCFFNTRTACSMSRGSWPSNSGARSSMAPRPASPPSTASSCAATSPRSIRRSSWPTCAR